MHSTGQIRNQRAYLLVESDAKTVQLGLRSVIAPQRQATKDLV